MTTTPKLGIPLISSQQSQPEVTHNTMVLVMQAVLGGAIAKQNAPPGSPADGDCYVIGTAGSGLWAGHNNAIAIFFGGWIFLPGVDDDGVTIPMGANQEGLHLFIRSLDVEQFWTGAAWANLGGGGGGGGSSDSDPTPDLSQLPDVHIVAPLNGDELVFDSVLGKWRNEPERTESSGGDDPISTRQVLTGGVLYTTPHRCRQLRIRLKGGGGAGNGSEQSTPGTNGGDTIFNGINAGGGKADTTGGGGLGGDSATGIASVRLRGAPGGPSSSSVASATTDVFAGGLGGGQGGGNAGLAAAGTAGKANTGGGGASGGVAAAVFGAHTVFGGGGEGEYAEIIINYPASTYAYVIGNGGNPTAPGGGGFAGGAGGSGLIIVDEFY